MMTLIVISLLLFPLYYTHQFAWSQSQVSSDGQQQQSQTGQAGNNLALSYCTPDYVLAITC
jgi:hypothetical protein